MKLDIPAYSHKEGLPVTWSPGFEISVGQSGSDILIKANKAGLISLAVQLLTLAQDDVAAGSHFHYDEHNCLEDGSKSLIIEKHKL